MDTSQKQIKQLEQQLARLEKVVQALINRNHNLEIEVRRLKGNSGRAQNQLAAIERKLHNSER